MTLEHNVHNIQIKNCGVASFSNSDNLYYEEFVYPMFVGMRHVQYNVQYMFVFVIQFY